MKFISSLLVILALTILPTGCANKVPPNLSPAGRAAFIQHSVQKDLDVLRDIAIDAEAQKVISTDDARKIIKYHESAITIVHDSTAGWQTLIATGLDQLYANLGATSRATIAPYIQLVKAALNSLGGN